MKLRFLASFCAIGLLTLTGCGGSDRSAVDTAPELTAEADVQTVVSRIHLEGQPNFRDLGGIETADGRRVKTGEIYRSGELSHLTHGDVAALEELQIRTVVNFLLPEEIEKNGPDRLPEGVYEDL